jgi:hypothetical protein
MCVKLVENPQSTTDVVLVFLLRAHVTVWTRTCCPKTFYVSVGGCPELHDDFICSGSVNQRWIWWQGLGDTQRQAWELITGPSLGAKARFLPFNRAQTRAVTGLLTGHDALRRELHLVGLSDSPLCRRCGAEDETSAQIFCECEALASLRHAYLDSFLEPEDIKSIRLGGPSGTLAK